MADCLPPFVRRPYRRRLSRFFLIPFLCAAAVAPAAAQSPSVVTGLVTDPSGGVLPGVAVEALRGLRVLAVATTGADGRYRLELPAEGAERVSARLAGFVPASAGITVAAGETAVVFRLDLAPLRDKVVVTASRTRERRAAVTESHAVFAAEDIERLGSHSVADVLRQVPGFSVQSTGREGSVSSLYARGGESDYNHVLIDGVRVNADGGGYERPRLECRAE